MSNNNLEESFSVENSGTELDLNGLLKYITGKIFILILGSLVGAVLGFGYSKILVTPKYEAVSKIYIVNSSGDTSVNLSDLQVGTNLVNDYISLIKNRTMIDSVITDLDLPYSYEQLSEMITVVNPVNTRELNLVVVSTDPEEAQKVANELASKSIQYLPEITGAKAPSLVEKAVFPNRPSIPNTGRNTIFGAFLGFLLTLIFFIIKYLLNDSYRSSEDIQRAYGVMPLASIPEDAHSNGSKKKRRR